jgi:hypothetical protein
MASSLTPPVMVAALVVILAALAKLRSPAAAGEALATLGLTAGRATRERLIQALAAGELALGIAVVVSDSAGLRAALGGLYLVFAAVTLALIRRHAECGCFGDAGGPASAVGVGLNLGFAVLCLLAAVAGARDASGVIARPTWQALVAILAIGAAAAAATLGYTELPRAWRAWSGA